MAESKDGVNFHPTCHKMHFKNFLGFKKEINIPKSFAISPLRENFFLSYKHKIKNRNQLKGATSKNCFLWTKPYNINLTKERAIVLERLKKSEFPYLMFFGDRSIKVATSDDLSKWEIESPAILKPRNKHFDSKSVSIGNAFPITEGIAVFYLAKNKRNKVSLGVAILDNKNHRRVIWRSVTPIWERPRKWKNEDVSLLGIIKKGNKILSYWENKDEVHVIPLEKDWEVSKDNYKTISDKKPKHHPKLNKFEKNPIIKPNPNNDWEAHETFNPAAIEIDNVTHLLYRAIGRDGASVFGYASSKDGFNIDKRLNKPAYKPSQPFEFTEFKTPTYSYMSGGGWGGCEDPRLTRIDDKIYMTYTAFNGHQPPGVALTSIKVEDFLNQIWNWEKPILLSRAGEIQKNWVIFPEKINGKFAVLHNINPVTIDYFNDLKSAEASIQSKYNNDGDENSWDNIVRGAAAPPTKTPYGWLLLYHAMDKRDPKHYLGGYWSKVGAMILDYNEPTKILHRAKAPLLEAEENYEKEGAKAGAVYVCGTVVKNEKIFVYYGAADSVSCVATAPIKEFLTSFINSSKPTLIKKMKLA